MVRWQVVGQIESCLSNRANDFRELVNGSSLAPDLRSAPLHQPRVTWYERR